MHAFNLKYLDRVAQILPFGIYTIPECSVTGEHVSELIHTGLIAMQMGARTDSFIQTYLN